MFLLAQISIIAGTGYGLSHIPISAETLLWLILTSVVWIGLLAVYVLTGAVDRVVTLLDDLSKKSIGTPQEKGADRCARPTAPTAFAVVQETSASWPCPSLRGLNGETVGFSASFSH